MPDETAIGPAEAPDGSGHPGGGGGDRSPFQTRAPFIQNWDWQSVVGINRGTCERSRAQHGINSETGGACAAEWEARRGEPLAFGETLDLLKSFHRKAPFLFFNGNTFAAIGRQLAYALFSDLPPGRKREVGSAIAHYIAGVLDRESMVNIVESLCASADLQPGDRVQTLRGTTKGTVLRLLPDGRVAWQPDGTTSELMALPESLVPVSRSDS
jgi:hypothetical protein